MNNQINRIPSLDGLRAVSISLVLIGHFTTYFGYDIPYIGNLGVRIFFVISGFLITSILAGEFKKTDSINLKKFYFRRTFRIFPAYYFYILFIFILTVLNFYEIPLNQFLIASTYTSDYFLPLCWQLGHSWSLSVEEQFYLLYPGIFMLLGISKTKKLLLLIIILNPILRFSELLIHQSSGDTDVPFWFIFQFHKNMDVLATGCLLALCKDTWRQKKFYADFLRSTKLFFLLLIVIGITVINFSEDYYIYYLIGLTAINISIALSIDWIMTNYQNTVGKILNSSILVFIGVMSYSIYLWQQPFTEYSEDKLWTHFPYNIILIAGFSLFSYYVIEKRFLQFRQHLENSLFISKYKEPNFQINK